MFDKFLIVNQQKAGTILLDTAQFGEEFGTLNSTTIAFLFYPQFE